MKLLWSLGTILLTALPSVALANETIETKTYKIEVTRRCPEGYISCDNVLFIVLNKTTGTKFSTVGKTVHRKCMDGETPCRFLGYKFNKAKQTYFAGLYWLRISNNGKEKTREQIVKN